MKKTYKFFVVIVLIFTLGFAFKINKVKAVSTTLTASSATVNSGEKFSVKITSSIKLSGWTISLTNAGQCNFVEAVKDSNVEVNGKSVYGTSNNGETNLATFNFTAPTVTKNTTYTITFSGTEMCDATDEVADVASTSCTATITVKAKEQPTPTPTQAPTSTPTPTPTSTPTKAPTSTPTKNTSEETPDFKNASGSVYTTDEVNLRDSWSTTSKATRIPKGTELTLSATSTKKVNNYVWYRVTYNGQTKYIASNYITTTKPEDDSKNNNLSSLKVSGVTLSPSFDKDTCFYEATVSDSVTSLDIKATAESENSTVKIEGNENLKEGENIVKITVTSKDDNSKIYTITVKKVKDEVVTNNDEDLKLSKLEILGVNFEDGFNPDLLSYELNLTLPVTSLTITATPNKENAKVEIIGNEGFVAGENLVTVIVTSADEKETVAYQIKVTVPEEASEPVVNEIMFYVICAIIIVVAIVVAIIVFAVSKAKNKTEKENIDIVDNKKKHKEDRKLEYQRIEEEQINEEQIEEEQVEKEILENDNIEEVEYEKEKVENRKGKHSN